MKYLACTLVLVDLLAACASCAGADETFRDCDGCPEMRIIEPATFVVTLWRNSEAIEQPVTIVKRFAVGVHEVTRGEYAKFILESRHRHTSRCFSPLALTWGFYDGRDWKNPGFAQDDRHPAVCISWKDAQAYVEWLSSRTGLPYRLPTQVEWEYVARAGTDSTWSWGEDAVAQCRHANGGDAAFASYYEDASQVDTKGFAECRDGYVFTAPVGSFQPNAFGLYDTIGNALEWTVDCKKEDYLPTDTVDVRRSKKCDQHVSRGGAFLHDPDELATRTRFSGGGGWHFSSVGFRVVRDFDQTP